MIQRDLVDVQLQVMDVPEGVRDMMAEIVRDQYVTIHTKWGETRKVAQTRGERQAKEHENIKNEFVRPCFDPRTIKIESGMSKKKTRIQILSSFGSRSVEL